LRWQNLAAVTPTGTTLTVTLTSPTTSNSRVVADAIRVAEAPAAVVVRPDGLDLANGGTVSFGSTSLGENVVKTITIENRGVGPLDLGSLTVVDGRVNGYDYADVFRVLTPGLGATTLPPGGSTTLDVRLNANWNGTYAGGSVSIPTNDTTANPTVVNLRGGVGNGLQPVRTIIDNGDAGFVVTSGTYSYATGQGYGADVHYNKSYTDNSKDSVEWRFTALEPGEYQVAATWSASSNRATNAPFSINGVQLASFVNQRVSPASFNADGANWHILSSSVTVGPDGTLTVGLSDYFANNTKVSTGYVIADAIRVVQVAEVPAGTIIDNLAPSPQFTLSGQFLSATGQGYNNSVHYNKSYTDTSKDTATWSYAGLTPGTYQVAATWFPYSNRTTKAPYRINNGAEILVNQQANPSSFLADGVNWQVLGEAVVGPAGTLTVSLSDWYANNTKVTGYVIADAIRATPLPVGTLPVVDVLADLSLVDDGDKNFSCTGCTYWDFNQTGSYLGDVNQLENPGTGSRATWSFELEPGVYEIGASWSGCTSAARR
jgi:uncharacterized protein (DUF2141 family)